MKFWKKAKKFEKTAFISLMTLLAFDIPCAINVIANHKIANYEENYQIENYGFYDKTKTYTKIEQTAKYKWYLATSGFLVCSIFILGGIIAITASCYYMDSKGN